MHHEILSEEESFSEFYEDIFSDSLSDIYTSVSEDDRSSEYGSDSDNADIRPTERQKALAIDSDKDSERETHTAGERSFASTEAWLEDNISRELEDFTGASGVTTEGNNPQNVSEITIYFGLVKTKIASHRQQFLHKILWSIMSGVGAGDTGIEI